MKKEARGFVAGMMVAGLIAGSVITAGAVVGRMQANLDYNNIKISLNGQTITPKDANGNTVEPFAINGTTYLPVRAVGDALGLDVQWNGSTSTVVLQGESSGAVLDELTLYHDLYRLGDEFEGLMNQINDFRYIIEGRKSGLITLADTQSYSDSLTDNFNSCNSFAGEMIDLCNNDASLEIMQDLIDAQGYLVQARAYLLEWNNTNTLVVNGDFYTQTLDANILIQEAKGEAQSLYAQLYQSTM